MNTGEVITVKLSRFLKCKEPNRRTTEVPILYFIPAPSSAPDLWLLLGLGTVGSEQG